MRKQWFGDSRDYVKWSCVRAEAGNEFAVVYGPMLRPDNYRGDKLDQAVVRFFDKKKNFGIIAELFVTEFLYLPDNYEIDKSEQYFDRLEYLIRKVQHSKVLVFLDPDTGIEPKSKATDEHLRKRDIQRICALLRIGEKLIVYQHSSRNKGWQESKFSDLRTLADQMQTTLSEPYYEANTAKDVCFFTFTKTG